MAKFVMPKGGDPFVRSDGGLSVWIGPPHFEDLDFDSVDSVADPVGRRVLWCSPTGYRRDRKTRARTTYRVIGHRRLGHVVPGGDRLSERGKNCLYLPIVEESEWWMWKYTGAALERVEYAPTLSLWLF